MKFFLRRNSLPPNSLAEIAKSAYVFCYTCAFMFSAVYRGLLFFENVRALSITGIGSPSPVGGEATLDRVAAQPPLSSVPTALAPAGMFSRGPTGTPEACNARKEAAVTWP